MIEHALVGAGTLGDAIDAGAAEAIGGEFLGGRLGHSHDQDLLDGFNTTPLKGKRQKIIYFCNFNFLYEALKIDPRVGMFLPCRVTVVEQDGVVMVMAINPMRLRRIFNNVELNEACHEMRDVYETILEDATL